MAKPRLELPVLQNWSCHNCGGCCRQHLIEVSEDERRRILDQNWTAADEVAGPVLEWHAGPPWKKRFRLAHQSDGGCVFLNEKGLCRIHAKFGEAAKPLACRIYPYAFHPANKSFAVSLRFSCPSVVANLGTPVSEQSAELKRLAEAVIPPGAEQTPPPRLNSRSQVSWSDFLPFVDALNYTLSTRDVPMDVRLARALVWVSLVGKSDFEKLQGTRVREFLGIVLDAARTEVPHRPEVLTEPSRIGRLYFRTVVAQYARKDTAADVSRGWRGRWTLLRAILQFTKGQGAIPRIQSLFPEAKFSDLEGSFGPLDATSEEILLRYFKVKIQGLHFCGPGFYDASLVEGFQSLALIFPVVLWLARWLAVGQGRRSLTAEDVSTALTIADHHHGYSPVFAQSAARRRTHLMAEVNDISKLCHWYAQ